MTDGEALTMRSIYVSSPANDAAEGSPGNSDHAGNVELAPRGNGGLVVGSGRGDDVDDGAKDTITLPQSTHSLLFTEPICSVPFAFGVVILCISCSSLSFALIDALQPGGPGNQFNIPADVNFTTRGAQYLAILIALLMEEEIPTGLYLLRMIPRKSFESQFKGMPYSKFVMSAVLRIGMGYLFLMNVFLVLIQATGVLSIFYDLMALQFIQQIDDVAFRLATWDMLGKSVYRATTAKCYRANFTKQKGGKVVRIFLKVIFLVNLVTFLTGLAIVTARQQGDYYQCDEVILELGDVIWEDAVVYDSGGRYVGDRVLIYSQFNGVYQHVGDHHGRPMYRELRKNENSPYETTVGAEIKYCRNERSWVFTHQNIRKATYSEESGCSSWLLRSPDARDEFDLLNVEGEWDIWVGKISKTSLSLTCNSCQEDSDCNFDGDCVDGKCQCYNRSGVQFMGSHCDIKIKDSCQTLLGEYYNDTWSVAYLQSSNGSSTPELLTQYMRPVYYYVEGNPVSRNDLLTLIYSGGRWFGVYMENQKEKPLEEWVLGHTDEYHAFWDEIYSTSNTIFVSDPTTSSTPAGVDFYLIGEREPKEQFGPFGELIPMQLYNQTGRGIFRCGRSGPVSRRNGSITPERRLELKQAFVGRRLGKPGA